MIKTDQEWGEYKEMEEGIMITIHNGFGIGQDAKFPMGSTSPNEAFKILGFVKIAENRWIKETDIPNWQI